MYYVLYRMRDGTTSSGWFETSDGIVLETSPAWKRFEGGKIYFVIDHLRREGYRIYVYENRDARKRGHVGREPGR